MTTQGERVVAGEQIEQFARRVRELQERLEKGVVPFGETMAGLQALLEGELEAPANLVEIFGSQIARLIEVGAHEQVGQTEAKYRERAEAVTAAYIWRPELAAIGLDKLALVDLSLLGEFLAKAGGVTCHIDPDKCTNYQRMMTPTDQMLVIQGQWGPKYKNKKLHWCRENFHQREQGCVVKEGLTVFLYEGIPLLEDYCVVFPGSVVSEHSFVPYLSLHGDKPCLSGGEPDGLDSCWYGHRTVVRLPAGKFWPLDTSRIVLTGGNFIFILKLPPLFLQIF